MIQFVWPKIETRDALIFPSRLNVAVRDAFSARSIRYLDDAARRYVGTRDGNVITMRQSNIAIGLTNSRFCKF